MKTIAISLQLEIPIKLMVLELTIPFATTRAFLKAHLRTKREILIFPLGPKKFLQLTLTLIKMSLKINLFFPLKPFNPFHMHEI